MSKRKKSQKWLLEHYECSGQLTLDEYLSCKDRFIEMSHLDFVPPTDRFVDAYDSQDYYDMTHFEPEDFYDYNPCAECYPRTEECCKHCYVNGG